MPSWRLLALLGAIAGRRHRTAVGTRSRSGGHVGRAFARRRIDLYVVLQLVGVAAKSRRMDLLAYGLFIGLIAGFLTDAIVTAAGV